MADLRFPVSLGGRQFQVSRKDGRFGRRSIPLQKAQQDTSGLPGEQSLNPEDLWRRSFESWHRGAGQEYFDWEEGDKFRFRSSLGVDPWTEKRLSLLAETEAKLASTASSVKLVVAGSYLYVADGQTLKFTQSVTAAGAATWTTVTGTPAADVTGLASDGSTVYVAFGNNGIYTTTAGAASAAIYSSQPASVIGYVKGRLMVAKDTSIYNVVDTTPGSFTFINQTSDGGNTGSSIVAQIPLGGVSGDVVIVAVSWASAATLLAPPAGWNLIKTATAGDTSSAPMANQAVYWKRYEGETSATFVMSGALDSWSSNTLIYRNAASGELINVAAVTADAAGGLVSPSVTTTELNTQIVSVVTTQKGTSVGIPTEPAGMTLRSSTEWTTTYYVMTATADVFQPAIGASGTKTWSVSSPTPDDSVLTTFAMSISHPDALFTPGTEDFTWVGFAEGQGDIYAAGYSGDKSLIYRTQVRADGTALDAPVVAGSLPDGEIVRAIYGYLGILFIGTDNGVRMATSDANGDLTIGARINTAGPVRCFEGQENFVWFGLEDYDVSRWATGTYDGLGRLDLTQQIETLVPAWASDLMAAASTSTTESVQSIVTFQDRRLFSIGSTNSLSRGVYGEKANKVAAGYLDSGLVTYGIADTKVATYLDVRHKALTGTLEAYVSTDEGAFASVGTSTTAASTRPATDPFPVGPTRGDVHEVRVRLNRLDGNDTTGPVVTRLTLRSEPAPARGRIVQWPLIIATKQNVDGREVTTDPAADIAFIEALFDTQTLITCREDNQTFTAFLKDYEFTAEHRTADGKAEQGVCTVVLKVPSS